MNNQVAVIGAGAGGMMAAGRAAELGAEVLILEKTGRPGNKILISGKTRCNLTNSREREEFIAMYGGNGRFLYRAFDHYFRDDLITFMRRYGVETKTERGGRVFPISDDAGDVVRAMEHYLTDNGVRMQTGAGVSRILAEQGRVAGVEAGARPHPAAAVILAAGGASFPGTGSTGDGYRMAEAVGHTVTRLRPALVPLVVFEKERARSMQGVSLRNVRLTAYRCPAEEIDIKPNWDCGRGLAGKRPRLQVIESRQGEMMMTHFGLGGPVTLQMSLAVVDALEKGFVSVAIDFKPALTAAELRRRLQREFDHYGKRSYRHILAELLPRKLIAPFIEMTGIPPDRPGHQIAAEERERLLELLKSLRFNIKSPLSLSAAMVTAGGVSLKEIDPRTMGSRLIKGLYFCGEVMDIDSDTGGYNLQAAFSTGYLAGESAARFALS
ncbi:NAD(P)/FAD-dependent oxidoreductase [Chloroflexota bacterium]